MANRAIKLSGSRAIFATIVHKTDTCSDVRWVPKPKDEPSEDYARRVAAEAAKRSVPQAFRQGGGSDLGLVGVQQSEFGGGASKTWVCHMAPRSWTQTDISAFLLSQGWRQVKVLDSRCFRVYVPLKALLNKGHGCMLMRTLQWL